jgi:hypothetical protein
MDKNSERTGEKHDDKKTIGFFVCLFVCMFVCSFVLSFLRSFVHLFVHKFVCKFVCLFSYLFLSQQDFFKTKSKHRSPWLRACQAVSDA